MEQEENAKQSETDKLFYLKGDELKRRMLDRLEAISDELDSNQEKLQSIGTRVLDKVEKAIKEDLITPYKAAVAYSKCTESMARMAQVQMNLFDRLNGTVGAMGQDLEESGLDLEEDSVEIATQREAEALVLELVRDEILNNKNKAVGE